MGPISQSVATASMMGVLAGAMAISSTLQSTRRRRHLSGLLGLLSCLALAGCNTRPPLPRMLFLSISINNDEAIDTRTLDDVRQRMKLLEHGFRAVHPRSHFQFNLVPEVQIENLLAQRNQAGLAPDLVFVNGDTALRLLQRGEVDPYPITAQQLRLFRPQAIARLRNSQGQLAGLPVMVRTQLACFNRRRVPQPPTTINELVALSAKGRAIGISIDPINLVWSAGSMGGLRAIHRAAAGQQPTARDLQGLERWLRWLQTSSSQQSITFFTDQPTAMAELEAGRLDWIACDSGSLSRLYLRLGDALGVSPLPRGPGGPASPLNRLRVMALGRNSTPTTRQLALAFGRTSITPQSQRALTLGSQSVLPANRFVQVPVNSSSRLAAMVTSARDGARNSILERLIHGNDPRLPQIQALMTELVFGELPPQHASHQLVSILRHRP